MPEWCVDAIDGPLAGALLYVTVVEKYDETTSYGYTDAFRTYYDAEASLGLLPSCGLLDGPTVGEVIRVRLEAEKTIQTQCWVAYCPDDFIRPSSPSAGQFRHASGLAGRRVCVNPVGRVVELGPDCVVVQSVEISYLGPSEYIPGVEGPTPPYLLEVMYFVDPRIEQSCTGIPALEGTPGGCIDHWVVDVERAPEE